MNRIFEHTQHPPEWEHKTYEIELIFNERHLLSFHSNRIRFLALASYWAISKCCIGFRNYISIFVKLHDNYMIISDRYFS